MFRCIFTMYDTKIGVCRLCRKMQALQGNMLALFMGELLLDAVSEIAALPTSEDKSALFDKLTAEEEAAYKKVLSADIPEEVTDVARWFMKDAGASDLNPVDIYKHRSFCHTALL